MKADLNEHLGFKRSSAEGERNNLARQETDRKEFRSIVKSQMASDLRELLDPYKNKDIGLRILSDKVKISEKTLKRILNEESDPHFNTISRFYYHYFKIQNIDNESELSREHKLIKGSISSTAEAQVYLKQKFRYESEELLETNKVFRDIFLYSRTGPITRDWVKKEYGKYGLEIVKMMIEENLLIETEKNVYSESKITTSKGPKAIKNTLLTLIQDHLSVEKLAKKGVGPEFNHAGYAVEGLSDDGYTKIHLCHLEYKRKLFSIMFDPKNKGKNRVFTIFALDRLKDTEI